VVSGQRNKPLRTTGNNSNIFPPILSLFPPILSLFPPILSLSKDERCCKRRRFPPPLRQAQDERKFDELRVSGTFGPSS